MALAALGTVLCGHPTEGALLLTMFQTSHVLEHRLTARAHGNLEQLFAGLPATALAVELDPSSGAPNAASAVPRPAESFVPGDYILVRPGSQVPLDGAIVYGSAAVSAEALTGESVPTRKGPGDELPAGALVHDGGLALRVTAPAVQSTPARMASLAMSAQTARPRLRSVIERFGGPYTQAVLASTALAFVGLVLAGVPVLDQAPLLVAGAGAETLASGAGAETLASTTPEAVSRGAAYRAMGLLTVASPCALVVAPLAYVAAIAALAKCGVLVTGGAVLDEVPRCSALALDKTGTLTVGAPEVADIFPVVAGAGERHGPADGPEHVTAAGSAGRAADRNGPARLAMTCAAALSALSTHPMSGATLAHAAREGVRADDVTVQGFRLVPGSGASARLRVGAGGDATPETYSAWFGAVDWVACTLDARSRTALESATAAAQARGRATSALALHAVERGDELELADDEGVCPPHGGQAPRALWLYEFADVPRASSTAALDQLAALDGAFARPGVWLVTGDNAGAARGIARQLGLHDDHVRAGLSPEDKLAVVRGLQADGKRVLFVGDGLNDAAALAAADVGAAVGTTLGGATGLAADVALINGNGIASLPLVVHTAQRTRRVVHQNLAIALAAAAVMAPATLLGAVPLWAAVAVHEGSTLLVAANSLRLLRQHKAVV